MARGVFIVIEGIEGSGKSTLAASLAESLTAQGRHALLTKEPGGTELGVELRRLLLDSKEPLSRRTETLLFLADRSHHVETLVNPSLASGMNVVCDRYFFSTLAYQGYARGEDLATLEQLISFAHGGRIPDLVLLVDLPVETALKRAEARKGVDAGSWNRFEAEHLSFHMKVRDGFLDLAKRHSDIVVTLDGTLSKADLLSRALSVLQERLKR